MRKCLRCTTDMVDNLELMVSNGGYGLDIREKGLFKSSLGKVKCAVCSKCGYVETYIENTEELMNLDKKEK